MYLNIYFLYTYTASKLFSKEIYKINKLNLPEADSINVFNIWFNSYSLFQICDSSNDKTKITAKRSKINVKVEYYVHENLKSVHIYFYSVIDWLCQFLFCNWYKVLNNILFNIQTWESWHWYVKRILNISIEKINKFKWMLFNPTKIIYGKDHEHGNGKGTS